MAKKKTPHPTAHANLSASTAKRWMNCLGSINYIRNNPQIGGDQPSVYADEGTFAHGLCARALTEGKDGLDFLDERSDDGRFVCDEPMADAIQIYVECVRESMASDPKSQLYVEQRFTLEDLNPPENMFGTADAAVYHPKSKRLTVIDFKYGRGVVVDATDNYQGRYYGIGAALMLKDKSVTEVEIVIVQPRAQHADGPVRRELVRAHDLLEWSSLLLDKAKETQDPNAPRTAGHWCDDNFCPGRGTCPEYRNKAASTALVEFNDDLSIPDPVLPSTLSNEQLAMVLGSASVLEGWIREVRRIAYTIMAEGQDIPGWKLVAKRARRYWLDPNPDEMGARLGLSLDLAEEEVYVKKLKSPAQIEKLLKGKRKELLKPYYEKRSSGATMARTTDPRPAVEGSVLQEFAALGDDSDE